MVLAAEFEISWPVAKDMGLSDGVDEVPVRMPMLLGLLLELIAAASALPWDVAMPVKGCALFRGLSIKLAKWVRFLWGGICSRPLSSSSGCAAAAAAAAEAEAL